MRMARGMEKIASGSEIGLWNNNYNKQVIIVLEWESNASSN